MCTEAIPLLSSLSSPCAPVVFSPGNMLDGLGKYDRFRAEGRRHKVLEMPVEKLSHPNSLPEMWRSREADRIQNSDTSQQNRFLTQGNRGFSTIGASRVGACSPEIEPYNIFKPYGSFDPPPVRKHVIIDRSPEQLRQLHHNDVQQRQKEEIQRTFESQASAFQKTMTEPSRDGDPFYRPSYRILKARHELENDNTGYGTRAHGMMDALMDKVEAQQAANSSSRHIRRDMIHTILQGEDGVPPIAGFSGVGLGNFEKLDVSHWHLNRHHRPADPLGVRSQKMTREDELAVMQRNLIKHPQQWQPTMANSVLNPNPFSMEGGMLGGRNARRRSVALQPLGQAPSIVGFPGIGELQRPRPHGLRHLSPSDVSEKVAPHHQTELEKRRSFSSCL